MIMQLNEFILEKWLFKPGRFEMSFDCPMGNKTIDFIK